MAERPHDPPTDRPSGPAPDATFAAANGWDADFEAFSDFELPTLNKSARVRLSAFRGERPVLLVFGSYT